VALSHSTGHCSPGKVSGAVKHELEVLWVTPQLPCLRSGAQVRQYNLLRHLSRKHRITVLSLMRQAEFGELPTLRQLGVEVIAEPFTLSPPVGALHNRLRGWLQLCLDPQPRYARTYPLDGLQRQLNLILARGRPDLVHFEHLFVAPLSEVVGSLPWILTDVDVESRKAWRLYRSSARPSRRLASWLEATKLTRWEQAWVRRASVCVAVSELDAAQLRALAPDTPIQVVPNGVDVAHFAPVHAVGAERQHLLFFGTLGYPPNADAVLHFCRDVLPRIQARRPEVSLTVVGPHAPPEVAALGAWPDIQVVGFVADVRPYLWRAEVCIVPLRQGGGTRLKILESLAAGCPVVSTTVGAEGLALSDGEHLVIADGPSAFADAVVGLLADAGRRRRLAAAGRQAVQGYDWATSGGSILLAPSI
jgi:glycosyltransferase involved in cell wall biosynthesis